jgi:hypothetical protein
MSQPPLIKVPREDELNRFFSEYLPAVYQLWVSVHQKVGFYNNPGIAKGAALTVSDANTPNSGDATTDAIIANLQTRVDELEARLDSSTGVGLFT